MDYLEFLASKRKSVNFKSIDIKERTKPSTL